MVFIQEIKIKDGAFIINLDEYETVGSHWIALYVNDDNRRASYDTIYFDSIGVKNISKENKKMIGNKSAITNIYKM